MNLLTSERITVARRELTVASLRILAAYTLFFASLVAILSLTGRIVLEMNFRTIVEQSTVATSSSQRALSGIHETNAFLRGYDAVRRAYVPWSLALLALGETTSEGIALSRVAIDRGERMHLEGRALHRDALLAYEQRLRDLPFLSAIAIPFSTFLQREQIPFTADADLLRNRVGE